VKTFSIGRAKQRRNYDEKRERERKVKELKNSTTHIPMQQPAAAAALLLLCCFFSLEKLGSLVHTENEILTVRGNVLITHV
jgi:hypothetical protein